MVATDTAVMKCQHMTLKAADNGHQIAGILHDIAVGCRLLLDGIGSVCDGSSIRHFLLLGLGVSTKSKRVSSTQGVLTACVINNR